MADIPRGGLIAAGQHVSERTGGDADERTLPRRITWDRFWIRVIEAAWLLIAAPILVGRWLVLWPVTRLAYRWCFEASDDREGAWTAVFRALGFVAVICGTVALLQAGLLDRLWWPIWWDVDLVPFLRSLFDESVKAPITLYVFTHDGNGIRLGAWSLLLRVVLIGVPSYAWRAVVGDLDWRLHKEVVQPMAPSVTFKPASPAAIDPPPGLEPLFEQVPEPVPEPPPQAIRITAPMEIENKDPSSHGTALVTLDVVPQQFTINGEPAEVGLDRLLRVADGCLAGEPFSEPHWKAHSIEPMAFRKFQTWCVQMGYARKTGNNQNSPVVLTKRGLAMLRHCVLLEDEIRDKLNGGEIWTG